MFLGTETLQQPPITTNDEIGKSNCSKMVSRISATSAPLSFHLLFKNCLHLNHLYTLFLGTEILQQPHKTTNDEIGNGPKDITS